jgi:hypothetical protein
MLLIFEKMKKSTNKSDFMTSFGSKWSGRSQILPIFGRFLGFKITPYPARL